MLLATHPLTAAVRTSCQLSPWVSSPHANPATQELGTPDHRGHGAQLPASESPILTGLPPCGGLPSGYPCRGRWGHTAEERGPRGWGRGPARVYTGPQFLLSPNTARCHPVTAGQFQPGQVGTRLCCRAVAPPPPGGMAFLSGGQRPFLTAAPQPQLRALRGSGVTRSVQVSPSGPCPTLAVRPGPSGLVWGFPHKLTATLAPATRHAWLGKTPNGNRVFHSSNNLLPLTLSHRECT